VAELIYIPTSSEYRFFPAPPSSSTFMGFVFLMIAILTDERWNIDVLVICIFLMAKDKGQFFMYFICEVTFVGQNASVILPGQKGYTL
jgi:hypothetical protein